MNERQKTAKEIAEVLLAYCRGEQIQVCLYGRWVDCPDMRFDYPICDYRIKPKAPVEVYVWKHDDGEASVATFPDKETCELVWGQTRGKPVLMREVTE